MRIRLLVVSVSLCVGPWAVRADEPRAKYGATATRLVRDREYVRRHEAPDFWALLPYYLPQSTDADCSTATAAMVVNALRVERDLPADEELATTATVLARTGDEEWRKRTRDGGDGVTLDGFAGLLRRTLPAFDVTNAKVEVLRFDGDEAAALARFREVFAANERTADDLLVANFLQSECTGDPEGTIGHLVPIAAYDATTRRVLLFDPDRRWYEPYWVSDTTLLRAMRTVDSESRRSRGLLRVGVAADGTR